MPFGTVYQGKRQQTKGTHKLSVGDVSIFGYAGNRYMSCVSYVYIEHHLLSLKHEGSTVC